MVGAARIGQQLTVAGYDQWHPGKRASPASYCQLEAVYHVPGGFIADHRDEVPRGRNPERDARGSPLLDGVAGIGHRFEHHHPLDFPPLLTGMGCQLPAPPGSQVPRIAFMLVFFKGYSHKLMM